MTKEKGQPVDDAGAKSLAESAPPVQQSRHLKLVKTCNTDSVKQPRSSHRQTSSEQKAKSDDNDEQKPRKSQATKLIELCSGINFFRSDGKNAFAKFNSGDHTEVWPVRSIDFKDKLRGIYFGAYHSGIANRGFDDAICTLESKASYNADGQAKPTKKVYRRIAYYDNSIYVDLCNDKWQVVKITANGWEVMNHSPLYFYRSDCEYPMPIPERGGSIETLRRFINCPSDDDWKMIVAWMLSALRPNSPYPILTIQGEPGSGKSTMMKLIKMLVDPDKYTKRRRVKNADELFIAANHSWVLSFDNLSGISADISDALCCISTGSEYTGRKLFTFGEQSALSAMNPIILNGIDDIAKRGDLLSRSIVINLPHIDGRKRIDEKTNETEFYKARPKILGALFDAISGAIREYPNVDIDFVRRDWLRMIDFALWSTAAESALGWDKGDFIEAYEKNNDEGIEQGIEADPFAVAVIQLIEEKKVFDGTPSQLIAMLKNKVDEQTFRSRAMPTSKSVRGRLRHIASFLRKKNIAYNPYSNRKKRTLKLVWSNTTANVYVVAPSAPTASDQGKKGVDNGADKAQIGADKKKLSTPDKPRQNRKGADGADAQINAVPSLNTHNEEGFEI
jgi:energy-coupling factor transporter ATP-binding protein EcfA2